MDGSVALYLCLVLTLTPFVAGVVYDNFADLPSSSYDFVIVGAGAAGSVVANRLTEDPEFSVLLLEAGGRTQDVFNTQIPWFNSRNLNTPLDWNFTTVPQSGLNGRIIAYPRGRGLGGSTAINALAYTRGTREDFDRYATLIDDKGWSWNSVQAYFRKNEKWSQPADNHDTRGQFDPRVHSLTGINAVSLAACQQPFNDRITQTTREDEAFQFNLDMNSGNPLGLGWIQTTIDSHGRRSSAATSYLAADVVARPNLHVLLHAQATRVLTVGDTENPLQFHGVEFSDESQTLRVVNATKEIILSAGSIMTPHILLHSGIGPSSELSAVGITPIHDLPSVGKNMSEHPLFPGPRAVFGSPPESNQCNPPSIPPAVLREWQERGQGLLAASPATHIAWLRIGDTESVKKHYGTDPSAGNKTPHIEVVVGSGCDIPPTADVIFFGLSVVSSASPMRAAVRFTDQFISAPAWDGYALELTFDLDDDDALNQFIKSVSFAGAHAVGTASMSANGSSYGVVDSDLRVKGVRGLRVVDASVLPRVPSAHTQAAAYVVGEKGSDLVKAAW